MTDGYQLMVNLGADTLHPDGGVDRKGEVKRSRAYREHFDIPFRRIDIDFFSQEAGLEILRKVDGIVVFRIEYLPDLLEPFVEAAFVGSALLIFPVGGKPFLGNLVHPPRPDLNFHPFTLRTHNGRMKRLIAV